MANSTGTATDIDDLFDQLITFATANGWTEEEPTSTNSSPALSRGDCFVQWRYGGTSPPTNRTVSMTQALAYINSSTDPGNHTDDSGNGEETTTPTDAVLKAERCISDFGDGPFSYWFFEDDADQPYIHVVVEVRTEEYRHFGFGTISKFGSWTGGEYAYGHYQAAGGTNGATLASATVLLDGLYEDATVSTAKRAATIHIEGMPNQAAAGKWGQVAGGNSARPDDRAGEDKIRIQGGFRSGPVANSWGNFSGAALDGLVPMYQIALFYVDEVSDHAYYLGNMIDVRGLNNRHFTPGEEVVIGSDTWVVFPMSIRTATLTVALSSAYSGIAYRKVT